jgi:Fic family protein
MKIYCDIENGVIVKLGIHAPEGITSDTLRKVAMKDLFRKKFRKKLVKLSAHPRLNKAAALIMQYENEYEVDVLVKHMNLSRQTARNYICELKKEGCLKWTS